MGPRSTTAYSTLLEPKSAVPLGNNLGGSKNIRKSLYYIYHYYIDEEVAMKKIELFSKTVLYIFLEGMIFFIG